MREIDELRPAPRPTPTAVLWVMAAVVIGGGAFLVWSLPEQPVRMLASSGIHATNLPAESIPRPQAPKAPEVGDLLLDAKNRP